MTMEKMDKFGLELVLKAHESEIKDKTTKIAAILHWCMLKKGLNFCGLGDNFGEDIGNLSEILPKDWSSKLTWKYREQKNQPNKFILKLTKDGDILNVILLRMSDEICKDFSVDLSKDISEKLDLSKEDEFLSKANNALLKDFFPDPQPGKKDDNKNRGQNPSQPSGVGAPRNPGNLGPGGRNRYRIDRCSDLEGDFRSLNEMHSENSKLRIVRARSIRVYTVF